MHFPSAGKRRPWGLPSVFSAVAYCLAAALTLSLTSCDSGTASPDDQALSCPELSAKHFGKPADDGHYQVIAPNGGESFRVGDSLRVMATSGSNDSEAVLHVVVFQGGKSTFVTIPGAPRTSIDLRSRCHWNFLIPDSAGTSSQRVSLVSDSLKIRVARYGQEGFVYDYSDAFFRIVQPIR